MRYRVVRNANADRAPLRVLQAARSLPGSGQEKGKGAGSCRLEQPKLPVLDARIATNLGQIGAYQGVVVVTVGVSKPANALQGRGIANMTAQRIAAVRRIGDQPAIAQDLRRLADQPRLRVLSVQFEILAQEANIRGRAKRASDSRPGQQMIDSCKPR